MKNINQTYYSFSDLEEMTNTLTKLNIPYEVTDSDDFLAIGTVIAEVTEEQYTDVIETIKKDYYGY
jgi:hypothetical protein